MAIFTAYPSGEEGGNFLVQMIATCLRYAYGGGGHPVTKMRFQFGAVEKSNAKINKAKCILRFSFSSFDSQEALKGQCNRILDLRYFS